MFFTWIFFGTMRLFFELLWIPPKGLLRLFRYFATQWMSKNPKGSPFHSFRHCDTVQKSHFKFFSEIFNPKGPPLNVFHILQPSGVLQSPKGPSPLLQF